MRIGIMSLYTEVGVSFRISHLAIKLLRDKLQQVFAGIDALSLCEKFRGDDFSLGFVISATASKDYLTVNGPTFFKKPPGADFVLMIPYREITDCLAEIDYVFDHVAEGVLTVLHKYNSPDPGVAEAVVRAKAEIYKDPNSFQVIPKKSASKPT